MISLPGVYNLNQLRVYAAVDENNHTDVDFDLSKMVLQKPSPPSFLEVEDSSSEFVGSTDKQNSLDNSQEGGANIEENSVLLTGVVKIQNQDVRNIQIQVVILKLRILLCSMQDTQTIHEKQCNSQSFIHHFFTLFDIFLIIIHTTDSFFSFGRNIN